MNKKIYLLRFNGGAGGDFLSYHISQDQNFYPITLVDSTNNTWTIDNPLKQFGINFKNIFFEHQCKMDQNSVELIDQGYSKKHLIIPTHWTGPSAVINLPRMVPINLQFTGRLNYLFYFLLWIKRYFDNCPKELLDEAVEFASVNRNIPDQINNVISRSKVYMFERQSLMIGLTNSYDVVENFFIRYKHYSFTNKTDYLNLDVGQLYQNPKNNVFKFSVAFNMHKQLDSFLIEKYFFENTQLFEKTFNKDFNAYNSDQEFLNDLKILVKAAAPDAYK
jgi:hypothetical protein